MKTAFDNKRYVRTVMRLGKKSLGITIPIQFVRELKWRERQKLVVSRVGRRIIVRGRTGKERQEKLL